MLKKFFILVFILLFFFLGFFISKIITDKKLQQILSEKNICQNNLQKAQAQKDDINLNDLFLYFRKGQALENLVKSNVHFSYQIKPYTNYLELYILLQGNDKMLVDAADLALDFDNNLEIKEIKDGLAFPLYPRKIIKNNSLVITGMAQIDNNEIKYGKTNTLFITVILNKINPSQPAIIQVDDKNTKSFLNGEDVLDRQETFNRIEI